MSLEYHWEVGMWPNSIVKASEALVKVTKQIKCRMGPKLRTTAAQVLHSSPTALLLKVPPIITWKGDGQERRLLLAASEPWIRLVSECRPLKGNFLVSWRLGPPQALWLWRRSVSWEKMEASVVFIGQPITKVWSCSHRDPFLPLGSGWEPNPSDPLWWLVMFFQGTVGEISLKWRDMDSGPCHIILERAWQCSGFHGNQVTVSSPLALETASSFWEQL